jgi:hypothetical protein
MATGASIAPYIHFELGQPIHIDYVWGRQIGENTIDPQSAGRTSGVPRAHGTPIRSGADGGTNRNGVPLILCGMIHCAGRNCLIQLAR